MIGYLGLHRPSPWLSARFHAQQCGLCHTLGKDYGLSTRLLAGQDLVFYAVFLEAMSGERAYVEPRSCVLGPGVTSLPAVVENESTSLAAAFGIWMMAEKARDDWEDDGGVHRWLAQKALSAPSAEARRRLEEHGFPVEEIRGWLARQVEVEAAPSLDVDEALVPTEAIARLAFGFAARDRPELRASAEAIGAGIGRFLFWMDNALDLDEDRGRGGYNALLRHPSGHLVDDAARRGLALDSAEETVSELATLISELEASADRAFLRAVLVDGFGEKVGRFRRSEQAPTRLRQILPPPAPVWRRPMEVAHSAVLRSQSQLRHALALGVYRVQLSLVLAVLWLFPRTGWAEQWWPEEPAPLEVDFLLAGAEVAAPQVGQRPGDSAVAVPEEALELHNLEDVFVTTVDFCCCFCPLYVCTCGGVAESGTPCNTCYTCGNGDTYCG